MQVVFREKNDENRGRIGRFSDVSDPGGSGTPGVVAPTLRTLFLTGMSECVTAPQAVVGCTSSQGGRLEPEKDDAQEPGRHQEQ